MRPNSLRRVLASGHVAVNGWISSDGAYMAEVLSHCGFDAVTIDLQHGIFGLDGALRLLQAVSAGPSVPIVRVASLNPTEIGKLLDGGAYGVICPSIDTPDEARRLVSACRYPPRGGRSYGPARGLLYGGPDYTERIEDELVVWAMIESEAALACVDEIAGVDGIDGLYVGPNDLAISLGEQPAPGMPSTRVLEALSTVVDAAHSAGRFAGSFCADGRVGAFLAQMGFDMVTPGNDAGLMRAVAAERLAQVRGATGADVRDGDMPRAGGGY